MILVGILQTWNVPPQRHRPSSKTLHRPPEIPPARIPDVLAFSSAVIGSTRDIAQGGKTICTILYSSCIRYIRYSAHNSAYRVRRHRPQRIADNSRKIPKLQPARMQGLAEGLKTNPRHSVRCVFKYTLCAQFFDLFAAYYLKLFSCMKKLSST